MEILNLDKFISEKMKIMPISNDEFDKIKVNDNILVKLNLDKMKFQDIKYGDIAKTKGGTPAIVLPDYVAENIVNIENYPDEQTFFVLYHYNSPSPFAFIEGKKYEKKFPECDIYNWNIEYKIIELFRPIDTLDFNNWFRKDFSDFFKKIKHEIEHSVKLSEWDVSKVQNISTMFSGAQTIKGNINTLKI